MGLGTITHEELVIGQQYSFVIREEEVTGGSSDGEGLQAVSCGPKGIGKSCSWDHTSTALGLVENGTQMKASFIQLKL